MVFQEKLIIATRGHRDMHDLTDAVAEVVEFEPGLRKDLPDALDRLLPPSRDYGHEQAWHDGNGHFHLQATLLAPSVTMPVGEAKLILDTWQQIFLLECEIRLRQRTITVTVMGEWNACQTASIARSWFAVELCITHGRPNLRVV